MQKRELVQISKTDEGGLTLYGWKRVYSPPRYDPSDADLMGFVSAGVVGDALAAPVPVPVADSTGTLGPSVIGVYDDVVWLPDGTGDPADFEKWMMYASLVGTKPGANRGRWGVCRTCQEEFPISQMVKIKGQWYCSKNGCQEDFE